jgi:RES domain-containing protein
MKVYRISRCRYIDDLSGTGAAMYPGRWNNKGTYVLYTAATPSLALLESVVHMSNIPVTDYCMVTLEVPDENIAELQEKNLPENWRQHPPPDALKVIGDSFVRNNKALALKLPSAIMPEDFNVLLNPNHTTFKKVKVIDKRDVFVDERLIKR